jgi:hypothetical protein
MGVLRCVVAVPQCREVGARDYTSRCAGILEAAGEGFEPSLTDPELILSGSPLFTDVPEIAYLCRIAGFLVSKRSPMFTPVTVKSLSKFFKNASRFPRI